MAKYIWTASSNDGAFEDRCNELCFNNMEDCYNDMRHHALEKMKWNTEYAEDFDDIMDDEYIGYSVKFYRNKIVHESYSGIYTYQIEEVIDLPTIPTIAEVKNDYYDDIAHCWCIDVYEVTENQSLDDVEGEVVAKIYDNGFVKILNPTLCANPMVIQSINEVITNAINK